MKKFAVVFLTFIISLTAQQKRPITVEDLWSMKRIGSVEISPDGKTIAFSVSAYSMSDNKSNTDIYLIDSDGKNMRPLKNTDKNESSPKFSPDGKKIAYIYEDQIWTCNPGSSDAQKLTSLSTGASGIVWSNDGGKILFVSSVYPDCENDECNKAKDAAKDSSKIKASIFKELMYRHWNEWRGGKRSHLFLLDAASKDYVDLTLRSKYDVPPIALGSANDYSFSPDGKEAAFTMNTSNFLATSTDNDIFTLNVSALSPGKELSYKKISVSKGSDSQPVYSPDGKYIAFASMERAGFEADKQRLMLYDRRTGELKELTKTLDRSVDEIVWAPDSKAIYFNSADEVNTAVYKLDINSGKIEKLYDKHVNSNLLVSRDGKTLFFKQQRTNLPHEIFSIGTSGGESKQLTFINKELLDQLEMNSIETFWSEGAEGAKVQSILLKPPFFDPAKKYPVIFLIHGGPQGNWNDDFHYRWNLQMFASKGYVVVAPNPRGSTGYGQKFTDEISKDWGGKVYIDLMNAYDFAVENFQFVDSKNTFAAGASYGGYMINWIAGHTDRFNALVSHAGVFNLESKYGTTEELWFPEWEFGGTPWQNREMYEKWSPHRFIQNCRTPVLVVHGANDFRVPEEQAFQLFTSLQRLGIESEFLYFPDETHFVSKPQNSRLWWNTIFNWFEKHSVR